MNKKTKFSILAIIAVVTAFIFDDDRQAPTVLASDVSHATMHDTHSLLQWVSKDIQDAIDQVDAQIARNNFDND